MAKNIGPIIVGNFPITQRFGENPANYARFGLAGHNGIDIGCPEGTVVLAGVRGVISETGEDPGGYGKYIKIQDPVQNLDLIFAHLKVYYPLIEVGYVTDPRNPIAESGNTGNTTGPHLHFAVGDTDSGGMRTNRENGYYGWQNPLDTSKYNLTIGNGSPITAIPAPSPTLPGGTTTSVPVGPTPPPYKPSFAGQTVSSGGNNFRSNNGSTWIFQGSDAERAAAAQAEKKRELAELAAKAAGAGVYLQKSNLSAQYTEEGLFPAGGGLADAEYLVITGPYEARVFVNPGGGGQASQWYTTPGRYALTQRSESIEVKKKPLPPAPAALPNVPILPKESEAVPGTTPTPAGAWMGKKAPTHKDIYNLIAQTH